MILTTADSVPGRKITHTITLVKGTDIYLVGGLIGGGMSNQENLFSAALSAAAQHIERNAAIYDADAVVGIKPTLTVAASGSVILALVGTAVKLDEDLPLQTRKEKESYEKASRRILGEKKEILRNIHEICSFSADGIMSDEEKEALLSVELKELEALRQELNELEEWEKQRKETIEKKQMELREEMSLEASLKRELDNKETGWVCPSCGERNASYRLNCFKCKTMKE